jgi:hypothetical protein
MCPGRTHDSVAEDAVGCELFSPHNFPANREKYRENALFDMAVSEQTTYKEQVKGEKETSDINQNRERIDPNRDIPSC